MTNEQTEYEQFLQWKHSGGMQQAQQQPRRSFRERQADWFADRMATTPEGQEAILRVADRIRAEQQGQPQQPHVVMDYPAAPPQAPQAARPPQAPTPQPSPQPQRGYDEGFAQDLGF